MDCESIQPDDLGACAEAFVEVFNGPPWGEDWTVASAVSRLTEIAHTPGFVGLKATADGRVMGFAIGYTESLATRTDYYLKEMCVVPAMQGQGVGTALLTELKARLVAMGVRKMYLLTRRDGPAAGFYEKNGFYTSDRMIMMGHRLGPPAWRVDATLAASPDSEGKPGAMTDHKPWMAKLIEHAREAARDGEAPVAAMIVQGGQVLGVGRNTKTSELCGFAHAELNALLSARGKLGRTPDGAVLYSTLEPCAMCLGAIIFAGIRTLVYGASDPQGGAVGMFQADPVYSDWMPEVVAGTLAGECEALKNLPGFAREGNTGPATAGNGDGLCQQAGSRSR